MKYSGSCAAPDCAHEASDPRFTASLSSIEAPRRRGTRIGRSTTQPKYFCRCCAHNEFPSVSSFDGSRIMPEVKSYRVTDKGLVALPAKEQYNVVHG